MTGIMTSLHDEVGKRVTHDLERLAPVRGFQDTVVLLEPPRT
jgi:hypothetical protein